jgi:uncharacterized protein DUF6879
VDVAYVGSDPESPDDECAAVHVDQATGDVFYVGKTVTAPEVLASLARHRTIGADESVIWQPSRMSPIVLEAVSGAYERDRQGPGTPTFAELLEGTERSVVCLEMRDTYEAVPAFLDWQRTGSGDAASYAWHGYPEWIEAATARGVRIRRARVVSEPVSDYIRWEHMLTEVNAKAGEEVRWLPRRQAFDLMLPGADFFMFDQRLVRFGFQRGDGSNTKEYEFTSDPRTVAQCVAAFEMVWDRAIAHEDYRI